MQAMLAILVKFKMKCRCHLQFIDSGRVNAVHAGESSQCRSPQDCICIREKQE